MIECTLYEHCCAAGRRVCIADRSVRSRIWLENRKPITWGVRKPRRDSRHRDGGERKSEKRFFARDGAAGCDDGQRSPARRLRSENSMQNFGGKRLVLAGGQGSRAGASGLIDREKSVQENSHQGIGKRNSRRSSNKLKQEKHNIIGRRSRQRFLLSGSRSFGLKSMERSRKSKKRTGQWGRKLRAK